MQVGVLHCIRCFAYIAPGLHKYSEKVYEACIQSFCALPVSALVDHRFFCVHGGISPNLVTLQDLQNVGTVPSGRFSR
jgi:serine/threonine-protein phosphatase 2B catalytic subunit